MVADDVMMDCYRLARWYAQMPETFLELPLSMIAQHMAVTQRVIESMRATGEKDE